jgi:hypothetical protein
MREVSVGGGVVEGLGVRYEGEGCVSRGGGEWAR